ncbi:MAG: nitrite reductase, copper-containing, partial [Gammaproteobacteria bacterium]|nr:nitrite reductase, copper-containing [Gammaproteobacteria bacterium]
MKHLSTERVSKEGRRSFVKTALVGAVAAAVAPSVAKAEEAGSAAGGLKGFDVGTKANVENMKRVKQKLVPPPAVPEFSWKAEGEPKIVEVEMVIEEKEIEIAPGAFYWAMTFNGSVPGPLIVAHEGDQVELTLKNPKSNSMVHNIDFHASTGALGGGALTHVAPGEEVVLRFKATKAGTFVYHCAPGGIMIPYHVVSGMNGAIMILPRDGLKDAQGKEIKIDKAYYIGEQDWYLPKDKDGKFKRFNSPAESMGAVLEVTKGLIPTHLTFSGKVGALTGKGAMKAKVGETVMFVHSQANRDTRIHLIGGHADYFWHGGSFDDPAMTNRETWPVFGGEAVAAVYTFKQPGLYAYVNHNLIEAIQLGAAAHVSVEGKWNNDLMKQVK